MYQESIPLYGPEEEPCTKAIQKGDSMLFFCKSKVHSSLRNSIQITVYPFLDKTRKDLYYRGLAQHILGNRPKYLLTKSFMCIYMYFCGRVFIVALLRVVHDNVCGVAMASYTLRYLPCNVSRFYVVVHNLLCWYL